MNGRDDQGGPTATIIAGSSATDRRVTEAQANRRDSTMPSRLPPSYSGQEMILKGDRWTTGVTREALQPQAS